MEGCNEIKKRVRDECDVDSPKSKLARVVDSSEMELAKTCMNENWNAESSESEHVVADLSAADEIQDDLLNILEDSDAVAQGPQLDSFIKSFEEEIQALLPAQSSATMTPDHNESQPELGYLFEASDDELGLPPTGDSHAEEKIEAIDFTTLSSDIYELEGNLGFEDGIPCYDSLEIGIGVDAGGMRTTEENEFGGEFVALGGLFDYSDVPFRAEWLSAL